MGARRWLPAVLVAAGCGAPSGDLNLESDARLIARMEEHLVPGVAVAVIRDRELDWASGFGVRRAGETAPVTVKTVFQAASLSKPVVAYGVHALVRAGKLDLDTPLSDYLDSPYIDDPRLSRITARMALSHSTGFPNWRPGRWSDDPGALEIEFDPGTRFQYSGEGYVYMQHVVEEITGESLDVYLKRTVLDPLGMVDSSFVWEERFESVHASPHDGDGVPGDKWRPSEPLAAGTLQTTVFDYARFVEAMLAIEAADRWPLDDTALDQALEQQTTIDEALGWSLGFGVESTEAGTWFWQWGDDGPFKAFAAGSRVTGDAVVILTNGQWGLDVARPTVEEVLGKRAFLDFRMIGYRR